MTKFCDYKLLAPASAGESNDLVEKKSPEDGLRRMQSLLADWLRMENVVVLTAAGSSVLSGGRLMNGPAKNNIECLVIDAVEQCPISDDAKSLLSWKKQKDFGQGNFERWLSFLFNASSMGGASGSPFQSISWKTEPTRTPALTISDKDLKLLCEYIEKAVYAECALEIDTKELTGGATQTSGHVPFLAKLIARDTNLGRTHLFTLNYDTLLEQTMEELGIQYFDGFSGKGNARFDPAVYGLDIYYPGDVAEGRVRRFDKFLQFYKLHGSIHWYVDGGGVYHSRHRPLGFAKEYRDKDPKKKAVDLQSPEFSGIKSFGILPTSQKFARTLDSPFSHLFRLFHARLNQPQTFLLVLGYGFGDDHVTRIIETALTNPSLVMLVVEPNPESEIIKRVQKYQALGQRAFVLTQRLDPGDKCSFEIATFADFAENVMPDVKWLDEYKRMRAFEDQIKKMTD